MLNIKKNLKLHFLGIGGVGMSGIAQILLNLGYSVSGSDINVDTIAIEKLKSLGAIIFKGHRAENIKDVDIAVYSSALDESNPELKACLEKNIPTIKRAEMLSELMRLKQGLAIAGTHGKTTTTSILSTLLGSAGYDPTYVIGGVVKNLNSHAKLGQGDMIVVEADESDGSFLNLNPIMTLVTNIDYDHVDFYETKEKMHQAYFDFIHRVPFYGKVFLNTHDEMTQTFLKNIKRPVVTFGLKDSGADYQAYNIHNKSGLTFFTLKTNSGDEYDFSFPLIGKHNVLNALGALSICFELEVKASALQEGLKSFEGVSRRLETLKSVGDFMIIDDYAHHPTEIKSTLEAVQEQFHDYEIDVIFQPHRFSRTKHFWSHFVESLSLTRVHSYILPIYPAGEKPIEYVDSQILSKAISKEGFKSEYIQSLNDHPYFKSYDKYHDKKRLILCLGAGTISKDMRNEILKVT